MSLEDMQVVYADFDGTNRPHLKSTLAVLAFHAHRTTGRCCPSFDTIGWETGVSKRTAIRNVEALIEAGVLEKVAGRRQGGRGRFTSNDYRLRLDRVTPAPYGAHDSPSDADDTTGCHARRIPGDAGDTVTGLTKIEHGATPPDLPASGSDDEPTEEERARRAAILAENRRLMQERNAAST